MKWDEKHRENHKMATAEANRKQERRELSRELMKKNTCAKFGHSISEDTRQKISNSLQGEKNPRYGKQWGTPFKNGLIPWNKGIKCPKISHSKLGHSVSKEARQKIRNFMMGHIPWNKGIKYTEEQRLKYAVRWDADYIARVIPKVWASAQRKPNKLEKRAEIFLKSIDPRCRYVGDGKMWISGRNPDFIIEGTNKLIEVFGSYWHEPDDEEFRKSHFKSCGFNTLVIWDKEFQDPQFLREKVSAFVS
jgi:G:T-mismatch repair DNA endonuclease (very short patch repair protein)